MTLQEISNEQLLAGRQAVADTIAKMNCKEIIETHSTRKELPI